MGQWKLTTAVSGSRQSSSMRSPTVITGGSATALRKALLMALLLPSLTKALMVLFHLHGLRHCATQIGARFSWPRSDASFRLMKWVLPQAGHFTSTKASLAAFGSSSIHCCTFWSVVGQRNMMLVIA